MRVKCISDKGIALPKDLLTVRMGFSNGTEFALKVENEYIVYGMTLDSGYMWYYLDDEFHGYYPVWYHRLFLK
jgi:hypothetical protein